MPSWSQDGQSLYFNSNRGGYQQLWKAPVTGPGRASQISAEIAADSWESPDGALVYFTDLRGRLWQAPAQGGTPVLVPQFPQVNAQRLWAVTAQGIWYIAPGTLGVPEVHLFDPRTRQTSRAAVLPGPVVEGTPSLSPTPDGRRGVYSRRLESKSQLLVLGAVP